jgi:hypothetical protein
MNTSIASSKQPITTPLRANSSTTTTCRMKVKIEPNKSQQLSRFHRLKTAIQTFWKRYRHVIIETIKALLVGTIIGGVLILLKNKGSDLIPQYKGR